MWAYSAELRSRVLAAVLGGQPPGAVAERFGVSVSWVRRARQRHRDGGDGGPRPRGHRPQALATDADRIRPAIAADPDAALAEPKARLGRAVSLGTLWRAVARLGLTLKKSRRGRPSRTARTWPPPASPGGRANPPWIRRGWCASTRRGRVPP